MKTILEKRLARLEKKRDELKTRGLSSENIEEVRSINTQIADLNEEIEEIREELKAIDETIQTRAIPENAKLVNGEVVGHFERSKDMDSKEYRTAFMNYVLKNQPIPAEMRNNENTLTSDVASVIPTVIINRIIEGLTVCGMILPLVTRTSYAAGVVVPTSSVKPVASWVNEGASSDRQKKTTGQITFSHFKLRCEISMSMEVGTMALEVFENTFVANVVDAMTVALEKAILAGNGTGQPTGILKETPANIVTSKKSGAVSYEDLCNMEAILPIEFDNTAKYFMTKAQFMSFIGATDDNGQPIARVDYGLDRKPVRMLLGRDVVIIPYSEEMGNFVAGLYDFKDYVLNTIYDMGIQRKQDWDTEDLLTKAVMSVDGKPVDLSSLVVLQLKA